MTETYEKKKRKRRGSTASPATSSDSDRSQLTELSSKLEVIVEDEFLALIPSPSFDELKELTTSVTEYGGARDPLIAWDRGPALPPILIDGHQRLRICQRLGLPYRVLGLRFDDKDEALNWMRRNQLGRRNLSRNAFILMLGELYNRMKLPVGGKRNAGQRTRERFATEYGVDPRTVDRAGAFQAAAHKLGLEEDIALSRIRVSAPQVIAAAKTVGDNPTKDEVRDALHRHRDTKDKRNAPEMKGRPSRPQGWLIPAEPADCLKAIHFYAKSFLWRRPDGVESLNSLLLRLIEENELHVLNLRHEKAR